MTIPSLALGLVIALLIGTLFHLFLGGGLGRLFLYLIFSLIGSAAGQYVLVNLFSHRCQFGLRLTNLSPFEKLDNSI